MTGDSSFGAADPTYDSCAAFFGALAAGGVTDVVLSPGSRSTPLAITAHHQPGLRSWVQLDERSAGFFALGLARTSRRPAALVCTSGTAAANYLPAVIEAHYTGVPLVIITADRPPELRDWGAGQTIDQVHLFGTHVRWFVEPPVGGEVEPHRMALLAARVVATAMGPRTGPVHINWPLREPLEPAGWVPPTPPIPTPVAPPAPAPARRAPSDEEINLLVALAGRPRGVIVPGPIDEPGLAAAVTAVSVRTGWPVLAEPSSQLRCGPDLSPHTVSTADHLLKQADLAAGVTPEVVIRIGQQPVTKPVRLWLERHAPEDLVLIDPDGAWPDPSFTFTRHLAADPVLALQALARQLPAEPPGSAWSTFWATVDAAAVDAVTATVDGAADFCEPAVVRTLAQALPDGALIYVSNSMPVRDLDAFLPHSGRALRILANRGASGIDGLASCALGAAAAHEGPVVLFTGDLAFLHDIGGLLAATRLGLDLTVVVVDNNGGGIFSFLPIAAQGESIDFRTLFHTPHDLDLAGVSGLAGVEHERVSTPEGLGLALAASIGSPGVQVIEVPVDPVADLVQHRAVTAAVGQAIAPALVNPTW
ncbi:MAG: 2-succinyl-5-enolpyruvyl-6-hydroxy-3-cyclohexene-1-carboxylic-acid synthase [Actinomycetia bacterium]|nr:2-succinyl-5-enolpyruvyl-6-hydroxy-3-cyclohexene-1-carboxylic-acid synthase [Actinomycetes bacterium]